jgi:hypothetical protein
MLIISIILLALAAFVYFNCSKKTNENFTADFRPIHLLPNSQWTAPNRLLKPDLLLEPGYQEDDYLYYPRSRHSVVNETKRKYCKNNPACYPCPGWTKMGLPFCPPN